MKKSDVQKLTIGLYIVYWKDTREGGRSLASVGVSANGDRWLAPANWLSPDSTPSSWRHVSHVLNITPPAP